MNNYEFRKGAGRPKSYANEDEKREAKKLSRQKWYKKNKDHISRYNEYYYDKNIEDQKERSRINYLIRKKELQKEKKRSKHSSKKLSRKLSKKLSKKLSRKQYKKLSREISKKYNEKNAKKQLSLLYRQGKIKKINGRWYKI